MSGASLRLVLASSSPRRQELLARLGLPMICAVPTVDESPLPNEPPVAHVQRVALAKARVVAATYPGEPTLAADTSVVLGDEVLGKPADLADAARMLTRLRGRAHTVLTATVVAWAGREAAQVDAVRVVFAPFSDEILQWYLATGEHRDKAGAYALQGRGALLVERVEGNVQAVVGLPLARLPSLFAGVGLRLAVAGDRLALVGAPETPAEPIVVSGRCP